MKIKSALGLRHLILIGSFRSMHYPQISSKKAIYGYHTSDITKSQGSCFTTCIFELVIFEVYFSQGRTDLLGPAAWRVMGSRNHPIDAQILLKKISFKFDSTFLLIWFVFHVRNETNSYFWNILWVEQNMAPQIIIQNHRQCPELIAKNVLAIHRIDVVLIFSKNNFHSCPCFLAASSSSTLWFIIF